MILIFVFDSIDWFVVGPLVHMSLYNRLAHFTDYSLTEPPTPEYFRLFLVGLVGLVIMPSLYETAKVCPTRIGK